MPLIIGALGGGMRQIAKDLGMIFENNDIKQKTICEMQKTILMDSETMVRKCCLVSFKTWMNRMI